MDKQQKLKIALPILILVMVIVWGPMMSGKNGKKKDGSSGQSASNAATQGADSDLLSLARFSERKKARTAYTEWGRNPFVLSEGPKSSVLEGIMWDAQNPKAIINGYILGIGDKVGTGEIVDIQQTSVTVRTGAEEKVYSLGQ